MSDRNEWVPLAVGAVVCAGLLALGYKIFLAGACGRSKVKMPNQQPNAHFVCTCKKDGKKLARRKRLSGQHPPPPPPPPPGGVLASLYSSLGGPKGCVPVLLMALFALFKIWGRKSDKGKNCITRVPVKQQEPNFCSGTVKDEKPNNKWCKENTTPNQGNRDCNCR